MPEKIQIVLPKVVPDCSFVVLSVVRNELRQETWLVFAWVGGKARVWMTKEEIDEFVQKVRASGSILPDMDIETYYCGVF